MAAIEGASRIKRAGIWILFLGVIIAIVGIAGIIGIRMLPYRTIETAPLVLLVIYFGYFPAFIGGTMWIAGWIVEGFAHPSPSATEKL